MQTGVHVKIAVDFDRRKDDRDRGGRQQYAPETGEMGPPAAGRSMLGFQRVGGDATHRPDHQPAFVQSHGCHVKPPALVMSESHARDHGVGNIFGDQSLERRGVEHRIGMAGRQRAFINVGVFGVGVDFAQGPVVLLRAEKCADAHERAGADAGHDVERRARHRRTAPTRKNAASERAAGVPAGEDEHIARRLLRKRGPQIRFELGIANVRKLARKCPRLGGFQLRQRCVIRTGATHERAKQETQPRD